MPIEKYSLEEVEKAEELLKIAENAFNQSGNDADQENYERLLNTFEKILMKHRIISEIKAYQYRNDDKSNKYFEEIHNSLEEKYTNYFGVTDILKAGR